jgi:chromate reductase, NAD(P)H dehydrogenase (quinone)
MPGESGAPSRFSPVARHAKQAASRREDRMRVVGISGSLRKGSFNSAALRAAQSLAPEGMTIERVEIGDLPLYNDDLRTAGFPPPAERLRAQLAAADGILFVTPEYNYSVSGVLKNAIDWASRPPNQPFDGKPVAVMGASPGLFGTARAQYHLRQMMVFLNAFIVNRPEVMIGQAPTKFDQDGNLTDEQTREFIRKLLVALRDWTERLKKGAA